MIRFNRFIIIVLDGCGIGEMPDADKYGDVGSDTLGNILARRPLQVPWLQKLGLANVRPLPNLPPHPNPIGAYGKGATISNGKDTTTGHWEMAGIFTEIPFPTYANGFPASVVTQFEKAIGRQVLGNIPASGTEIIARLGKEHMETGKPIVYTSADSVFQIAAHEEIIPLKELYRICEIARKQLTGKDRVGRVIARPFIGAAGNFKRTPNRRDFAVLPPEPTLLDRLKERGLNVTGIGKIADIFCKSGITTEIHTVSNQDGIEKSIAEISKTSSGLIFTNLVDFDMLYGHRNDVEGYARALEELDNRLPHIFFAMKEDDCLILTSDHGNDPTTPSTDHSREYVPILGYNKRLRGGINLGTRRCLGDIGQTIAENFNFELNLGKSFLAVFN